MDTKQRAKDILEKEVGPLTFGKFLRVARQRMALTQVQLAQKLGVTKSFICDLEKGRELVSPSLAFKIAKKAGLSQTQAVELCLQDHLKKAKIRMIVSLKAA